MAKQYWVKREGKTYGPYTGGKLKQMAAARTISTGDMISTDQINWQDAGLVKGLFQSKQLSGRGNASSDGSPPVEASSVFNKSDWIEQVDIVTSHDSQTSASLKGQVQNNVKALLSSPAESNAQVRVAFDEAPTVPLPRKRSFRIPILVILPIAMVCMGVLFYASWKNKPAVENEPPGQSALEIKPAKNVDEKLFLLRMLDDLHSQLPSPNTDAKATQTKLGQLRYFAKKVHMYVKQRKLDDSLATLFGEYVEVVDAYSDFLANIDKIERNAVAQAERDALKTGFDAGFRGGSMAAMANNQGYSGGDAAAIGILTGIISAVADSYQKDQKLQEVKRQAVTRASRDVQDKFSTFQARAELTAAELTRKNGWKKGEAGFDEEVNGELRRLIANEDWKGYWRLQRKLSTKRPRDPFIKTRIAENTSFSELKTSDVLSWAKECVKSARLVPEGALYDPYRLRFLRLAGAIANEAFFKERRKKGFYGGTNNATASYAVRVWDACLKYSSDPTGEIRELRAWALGATGNIKEAVKQAKEVCHLRRKTVRYAYNYACLMSVSGETDTAFEWLSYAIKTLGCHDISGVKRDPDLAAMRKAKQKEFNDLVAVKYNWDINWGVFNDDIILHNNSAFTITNIALSVRIVQENKVWTPVLKVNSVAPGSSHKWVNVVSIPERRTDKATAALSCDQNK